MNILLVPYDGRKPGLFAVHAYDLVLVENEDGNFAVTRNRLLETNKTTVTVWDRRDNE